jgi:hypothetical protein
LEQFILPVISAFYFILEYFTFILKYYYPKRICKIIWQLVARAMNGRCDNIIVAMVGAVSVRTNQLGMRVGLCMPTCFLATESEGLFGWMGKRKRKSKTFALLHFFFLHFWIQTSQSAKGQMLP